MVCIDPETGRTLWKNALPELLNIARRIIPRRLLRAGFFTLRAKTEWCLRVVLVKK